MNYEFWFYEESFGILRSFRFDREFGIEVQRSEQRCSLNVGIEIS